jgi:hypothetical protein
MTPEPRNEAAREFEREFGAEFPREFGGEFGALANQHHDHPRWFRRGTGVAKPGCPCPE